MLNRRPELATNATRDPGVPHPENDRASPFHFGRRPRSMQLRQRRHRSTLQHQRQHSHTDRGLSTTNPVLPGPIWVSLLSPYVKHTEKSSGPSSGGAAARTYHTTPHHTTTHHTTPHHTTPHHRLIGRGPDPRIRVRSARCGFLQGWWRARFHRVSGDEACTTCRVRRGRPGKRCRPRRGKSRRIGR